MHEAAWNERYGVTPHRRILLDGRRRAVESLRRGGSAQAYTDASFVTAKNRPSDLGARREGSNVDPPYSTPCCWISGIGAARRKRDLVASDFPRLCQLVPATPTSWTTPARPGHQGADEHSGRQPYEHPMITNERQYRITKGWLKKFEASIALHERSNPRPDVHPLIHRAAGDAVLSEAEVLRDQLRAYERLCAGRVKRRTLRSLNELPKAIIEARVAAHVTQKSLAHRLGVAEQQVQRWEATEYAGVSVQRVQEIADALGATVTATVHFRLADRRRRLPNQDPPRRSRT